MPVDIADILELDARVKMRINSIAVTDDNELLNRKELASPTLTVVAPIIVKAIELAKKAKEFSFDVLPSDKLVDIDKAAKQVLLRFTQLKEIGFEDVIEPGGEGKIDNLLEAVKNDCLAFFEILLSVYSFLALQTEGFHTGVEQADKLINELRKRVDSELEEFKQKKGELDSITQIARDTAAQAGVAHHAAVFKEVAEDHTKASKRWLIAAATLIAITISVALTILYFFPTFGDLKEAAIIQRIITKLIILSSLYYAALWAAKNYRTHRHLSVLNLHRHNALRTFEAFVKAASKDDQTKNAVLLETTRSIFAPANTGYIGGDEESTNNRIIEIFKSVGDSSSNK